MMVYKWSLQDKREKGTYLKEVERERLTGIREGLYQYTRHIPAMPCILV